MNALILPFVLPEEAELPGRAPYLVTDRSRIADGEREEALAQQLEEALTPDEQAAALDALDAHQREVEEEAEQREAEQEEDFNARRDLGVRGRL